MWRSAGCEIVAATPDRAVEIAKSHIAGLTVRELKRWQEMQQEPLTEGVWMVVNGKWVKK